MSLFKGPLELNEKVNRPIIRGNFVIESKSVETLATVGSEEATSTLVLVSIL